MWIVVLIIIVLLFICLLEAYILLKDRGIVASYFCKAREMAVNEGWRRVIQRSVFVVMGKIKNALAYLDIGQKSGSELLKIAFYPTGGMGDYIISSKLIDELMMYAPCVIDVFCEKMFFGKSIYGGRPNVRVCDYNTFERSRNQYDLALQVEHFVHVLNMAKPRLEQLAPELYDRMKYIQDNWNTLYVNIPEQCWRERIHFEQCKALGLNRWTELRMGKAFRVRDLWTGIPLQQKAAHSLITLGLENTKYITVNRGADQMRENLVQLKVWPIDYYETFIKTIKEKLPNLKVVQLGGKNDEILSGVDKAVLGQDFEITKWVLKKSLCHIDCEGGLVHLAAQLATPCIVIFGPTPMHMYAYPQNRNLVSSSCNGCMGIHEDWAYKCYRGEDSAKCMRAVTPDMVTDVFLDKYKHEQHKPEKRLKKTSNHFELKNIKGKIAIVGETDIVPLGILDSYEQKEIVIFSDRENEVRQKVDYYQMGLEYRYSTTMAIAYADDSFDYVILKADIEDKETMREVVRVMHVGARLICINTTPPDVYQCVY